MNQENQNLNKTFPKTIFITGATSGFGLSCAKKFASAGGKVIITGRRADRLENLKNELPKEMVHSCCFDVRDRLATEMAIKGLPEDFKNIDVLINNAGLALGLEPAHKTSEDDWMTMIDTNIKGLIHCTRLILPDMVKRKSGHIINIGSIAGTYPYPGANVYGATKAFVKQFSLNLRADLAGTGVRVTNLEPGLAETEFSVVRFHGQAEAAAKVYEGTQPIIGDDVAEIAFWTATLPLHLNINRIEFMPTCQSFGNFAIHREKTV